MRYARIMRFVQEHPWAIRPGMLDVVLEVLGRRAGGLEWSAAELAARIGAAAPRGEARTEGVVAVIPVFGVMGHRAHLLQDVSSGVGTSTEILEARVRAARENPEIGAILLDLDSPGGSVFGVEELGDEIFRTRGVKPIVALANSEAASAAYWIASQADELIVTPSGHVGSIGVYAVHWDESQALADEGLVPTIISAGRYKVEGAPTAPLTAEARDFLQHRVDGYYDAFIRSVARGRGVAQKAVREGFGEGRMLAAEDARAAGLVDGIATRDEVLTKLAKGRMRGYGRAAAETEPPEIAAAAESAGLDDETRRRRHGLATRKIS